VGTRLASFPLHGPPSAPNRNTETTTPTRENTENAGAISAVLATFDRRRQRIRHAGRSKAAKIFVANRTHISDREHHGGINGAMR